MVENSKIEWTHHTFNPWIGCEKISPACDHCYAAVRAKRVGEPELWEGQRRRTTAANWRQPIKWNAECENSGTRARVFCASLADVFDNVVPDEWRADLFELIRKTPHLDWLLLTKRIGNAKSMLPAGFYHRDWPNVRIGSTLANQREFDRDIEKLLDVSHRIFISCEPLLGPIDMRALFDRERRCPMCGWRGRGAIGSRCQRCECLAEDSAWVIVGGESGPRARQLQVLWVMYMQRQCREAGVPIFIKQLGRFPIAASGDAVTMRDRKGGDMTEWPVSMRVREFPR